MYWWTQEEIGPLLGVPDHLAELCYTAGWKVEPVSHELKSSAELFKQSMEGWVFARCL